MGIWDRLGNVINSYLNDFGEQTASRLRTNTSRRYSNDPDYDAAYEELNDYLNNNDKRSNSSWRDTRQEASSKPNNASASMPPEELRADFECLGVPFGADNETCKAAYKKLLKIHHPDRHVNHEGNFKKATERSAKINAAYDRIEKWRNGNGNGT
jgi:curved DNA-binding protein CbpA